MNVKVLCFAALFLVSSAGFANQACEIAGLHSQYMIWGVPQIMAPSYVSREDLTEEGQSSSHLETAPLKKLTSARYTASFSQTKLFLTVDHQASELEIKEYSGSFLTEFVRFKVTDCKQ